MNIDEIAHDAWIMIAANNGFHSQEYIEYVVADKLRQVLEDAAKIAEFEHGVGTNGIGIASAIRHAIYPKTP